ncbi:fibrinogen C domain-containing protein 1-A-like [Haematobia irritans]|uniref:fibrinogen C domain-containing protein 1-A-like n=1 Tax=Haematobia irritans TaxID=7368 RepID=UPI003F4F78BC
MKRFNLFVLALLAGLISCTSSTPTNDEEPVQSFLKPSLYFIDQSDEDTSFDRQAFLENFNYSDWTTIQRRQDGSVNFFRNWTDYKNGFGNPPNGEFFVGLQKLYEMTSQEPHELLVILKDWNNNTRYAIYDHFEIGNEDEKYSLKTLGKYNGDAGDDLEYYKSLEFSTQDNDNDKDDTLNCADIIHCTTLCLNGPYLTTNHDDDDGVTWSEWKGSQYSLKFAEMNIRPKTKKE